MAYLLLILNLYINLMMKTSSGLRSRRWWILELRILLDRLKWPNGYLLKILLVLFVVRFGSYW